MLVNLQLYWVSMFSQLKAVLLTFIIGKLTFGRDLFTGFCEIKFIISCCREIAFCSIFGPQALWGFYKHSSIHPSICLSIRLAVIPFRQDWLFAFFWFFSWPEKSVNVKKWQSLFVEENFYYAKTGMNGISFWPKVSIYELFFKSVY